MFHMWKYLQIAKIGGYVNLCLAGHEKYTAGNIREFLATELLPLYIILTNFSTMLVA